jgi:putative redox protein
MEAMMDAKVTWKGKMAFDGVNERDLAIPLDTSSELGGEDKSFRPMELLILGLAGCTGMDVISILEKKKQVVTGFEVKVHGDRATDHPKIFTHIVVEYIIKGPKIDSVAVERAVELSETKYCSANAMLNKAAQIEHVIKIIYY